MSFHNEQINRTKSLKDPRKILLKIMTFAILFNHQNSRVTQKINTMVYGSLQSTRATHLFIQGPITINND